MPGPSLVRIAALALLASLAGCGQSTTTPTDPVSISAVNVAEGVAGEPYTQRFIATGGNGSFSWTVSSGTLPAGLALSGGGVLSGTPRPTPHTSPDSSARRVKWRCRGQDAWSGTAERPAVVPGARSPRAEATPVVDVSMNLAPRARVIFENGCLTDPSRCGVVILRLAHSSGASWFRRVW